MHDTESHPTRVLGSSGMLAEISPDRFVPGAYVLTVDGVAQSQVNLADPTELSFEYVRRMGHAVDLVRPPGAPITAIHLGAGALTLPRYVAATRPGSRQQVIELEPELIELVRGTLPLPRNASIRIRYGDARAALGHLPAGLEHAADMIVVDIFSGASTPRHVTTQQFFELVGRFVAKDGIVVVNLAGDDRAAARAQLATMRSVFAAVIVTADAQVLKGKREGNIVAIAAREPFGAHWESVLAARGPHPAAVIGGSAVRRFEAGAKPVQDAAGPAPSA